ncbi:MAG: hypothetical protein PUB96_00120 [Helicobacteraceae bacterium]|nr:hypothetical protein [Helicobacteraceae bacterium]
MDSPKVIGFERTHRQIGDCVIAIKALYALKMLYPQARLVIFTDLKGGGRLYKSLSFLEKGDKIVDCNTQENRENFKIALEENKVDVLLLLHRTSWKIKVAKECKIKRVITEPHMHTIFHPAFKSPFMMISYFVHGSEKILRLVRQIDTKHYDKNIKTLDFTKATFKIPQENKARIHEFLEANNAQNFKKIIGINIFGTSNSTNFSFALKDWIELINKLSTTFKDTLFIILTYSGNATKLEPFSAKNIVIFENNDDLLNLVELTSRLDFFLSINTGNIHIADNLRIPSLVLNQQRERLNCCGGSYGGEFSMVCLPKKWKQDYQKYYDAYTQKALEKIAEVANV